MTDPERRAISDPEALDLLTALTAGLTDQQISNDPGDDRWTRLVEETAEMCLRHVTERKRTKQRKGRS